MKTQDFCEALKVLGDETRLKVLRLLMERPFYVCQLSSALDLSTPTVSVHLSKLRKFGFVVDKKEGRKVLYSLGEPGGELSHIFKDVLEFLKDKYNEEVERAKRIRLEDFCPFE
ncbi:ArsR/SmtB family transcription factor [Thermovibrio sp.]